MLILKVFYCAVSFKNLSHLCNLIPLLTLGYHCMNRVESIIYIRKLNMLSHIHVWLWHKYHLFNLLRILFRPKISSFLKIANGYSFFILLSKELRQKGQRENLHKVNKVELLLLSVVILSAHLCVWSEI